MKPEILTALISAAAGLLGALIGFAGSQLANQRTVAQAQERRRFERAQEMQAEVIPKLFLRLKELSRRFAYVLDMGPHQVDEIAKEIKNPQDDSGFESWWERMPYQRDIDEIDKKLDELNEYFDLNSIWLPKELSSAYAEPMQEYSQHWNTLGKAHTEMPFDFFARRYKDALDNNADEYLDKWAEELGFRGQLKYILGHTILRREILPPNYSDHYSDLMYKLWDQKVTEPLKLHFQISVHEPNEWFERERPSREEAMWSVARKVLGVAEDERP
jgi:hypothetical protein